MQDWKTLLATAPFRALWVTLVCNNLGSRLAADQGNAKAQVNLGVMYDNGRGVWPDYAQAVKWYRLAADQGNASAQYNLGLTYNAQFAAASITNKNYSGGCLV